MSCHLSAATHLCWPDPRRTDGGSHCSRDRITESRDPSVGSAFHCVRIPIGYVRNGTANTERAPCSPLRLVRARRLGRGSPRGTWRVRPSRYSIGFLYAPTVWHRGCRALLSPRETDVRARAYIIARSSYITTFVRENLRRRKVPEPGFGRFILNLIGSGETPRVLFRSSSYRPIAQALTYNL